MNYYNENDPGAVAWLRELIAEGLIPKGEVDDRSILEVKAHEIKDFTQHHFFAGIGGWPYALDLAGWDRDLSVITGSCPCQPFSVAGKRLGTGDGRHLWPVFFDLIAQLRPAVCFGEQVASPAGREWLAGVRTDMEALGYALGAADLCVACVGAPHIRQRLFWGALWMADTDNSRLQGWSIGRYGSGEWTSRESGMESGWSNNQWLPCTDGKTRRIPIEPSLFPLADGLPWRVGLLRGAGNAIVPRLAAEFVKSFVDSVPFV